MLLFQVHVGSSRSAGPLLGTCAPSAGLAGRPGKSCRLCGMSRHKLGPELCLYQPPISPRWRSSWAPDCLPPLLLAPLATAPDLLFGLPSGSALAAAAALVAPSVFGRSWGQPPLWPSLWLRITSTTSSSVALSAAVFLANCTLSPKAAGTKVAEGFGDWRWCSCHHCPVDPADASPMLPSAGSTRLLENGVCSKRAIRGWGTRPSESLGREVSHSSRLQSPPCLPSQMSWYLGRRSSLCFFPSLLSKVHKLL